MTPHQRKNRPQIPTPSANEQSALRTAFESTHGTFNYPRNHAVKSTTSNADIGSYDTFRKQAENLDHLAYTQFENNNFVADYSRTLHIDALELDIADHRTNTNSKALNTTRGNSVSAPYNQTSHDQTLPHISLTGRQTHTTMHPSLHSPPLQRWVHEVPLQYPWSTVGNISTTADRSIYQEWSDSQAEEELHYGFGTRLDPGDVDNGHEEEAWDEWSTAATWRSGESSAGGRRVRKS